MNHVDVSANDYNVLYCTTDKSSACGCGIDTDSDTNSLSEACVLAETEASNSRALSSSDFRRLPKHRRRRMTESRVCACKAGVRRLLSQLLFTSIQVIIIKNS